MPPSLRSVVGTRVPPAREVELGAWDRRPATRVPPKWGVEPLVSSKRRAARMDPPVPPPFLPPLRSILHRAPPKWGVAPWASPR
eukprot:scaffold9501_cov75-Phaeocystis_antarctica.AAC.9